MGLLERALAWFQRRTDDSARQDFLNEVSTIDQKRTESYALFDRYYDGEHETKLNDRTRKYLEASGFKYAENFCETIVDALANRLHVVGFDAGQDAPAELNTWIEERWNGDEASEVQGIVHTQTPKLGDSAVAVDWSNELGRSTLHWNDPGQCNFVYDHSDRLVMVSKVWNDSSVTPTNPRGEAIRRLNLNFPDRIEKWFTTAAGRGAIWAMHVDAADEVWPTPWIRNDGRPRGIPIFHFRNKPKGRPFGRSELRSVCPQQDYLNKQCIDLAMILDNQAWAQRWATGLDPEKAKMFKNVPGEIWAAAAENAKFGNFEAAQVDPVLNAIKGTIERMAARSETPLHILFSLSGNAPSGEALETALGGMDSKVLDRQPGYGLTWSGVAGMMAGLEADFGSSGISYVDETFDPQWRDARSRSLSVMLDEASKKQAIGVSQRTTLIELGYDPAEEMERRQEEAIEAAARFAAGAGGGTFGGTGGGGGAGA